MSPQIGRDDIGASSFAQLFGALRMGDVLLSDEEYEALRRYRVERLEKYKKWTDQEGIKTRFDQCVRRTNDCHRTATEVMGSFFEIGSELPTGKMEVFERVAKRLTTQRTSADGGTHEPEATLVAGATDEWWSSSVEFFRFALENSENYAEANLGESLIAYFDECDPIELAAHQMHVSRIMSAIRSIDPVVSLMIRQLELWKIHRGILYVGICRRQGDAIKDKITRHAKDELLWSLTGGQVPGLDPSLKVRKTIVAWLGLDESEEKFFGTVDFTHKYIAGYLLLLDLWELSARQMESHAKATSEQLLAQL